MDTLLTILETTLAMYLDAAPWLVLGIVAAGLVHAFVPQGAMGRMLGGGGVWPVVKAALIGAPLPLCSCGVLPAAVGLRREGASKAATVSFLIATPETGPDSVAVSYALLGPVMAIVRPVAAILSAIVAGVLTLVLAARDSDAAPVLVAPSCGCSGGCATPKAEPAQKTRSVRAGLRYAFNDILDDIALWLFIGLVVAGVLGALVEPGALKDYGHGLPAMLAMLAFGVPLYVCATASTPIAAGLIWAGVSPGAALVFLLAGPATNIATLGVVGKDLGPRALAAYLIGIAASAVALGLALDWAIAEGLVAPVTLSGMGDAGAGDIETVPDIVKWVSALALAPVFVRALVRDARKRLG